MKWVLLLGIVARLASCRTIFDYERDGLENEQEGIPGKSVSGQYEWRAPDGSITEVSYIADHLGFRLVEDLELQPPTNPFIPSESTAQSYGKVAETSDVRNAEEEEEEEEEEDEENEGAEGEEEEEEEEEGEEEEAEESENAESEASVGEGGAEKNEETAAGDEAESSVTAEDASATKAEESEAPEAEMEEPAATKAEETESPEADMGTPTAKADEPASPEGQEEGEVSKNVNPSNVEVKKADEEESESDNNVAKSLDQTVAVKVNSATAQAEGKDEVEVKVISADAAAQKPSLIPVPVESLPVAVESVDTSEIRVAGIDQSSQLLEEIPMVVIPEMVAIAEPLVADEYALTPADAPVLATAEIMPVAEPMVAPSAPVPAINIPTIGVPEPAFADDTPFVAAPVASFDENIPIIVVADVFPEAEPVGPLVTSEANLSPIAGSAMGTFDDQQQMGSGFDLVPTPVEFPGAAVVLLGPFQAEVQEASDFYDSRNDLVNEALPVAEPLLQPIAEVSPAENEQMIVPVAEVNDFSQAPEVGPVFALDNTPVEPSIFVREIDVPVQTEPLVEQNVFSANDIPEAAPLMDVQEIPSAYVSDAEQTAVFIEPMTSIANQDIPSPLPLVQAVAYEDPIDYNNVPVETSPQEQYPIVYVNEVDVSELNTVPEIQQLQPSSDQTMELTPHQFQVTKASRSMDSTPVVVDKFENDALKDLYFMPESFQVPDSKPSQSAFQVIEVPFPQEEMMMIKAKSFSQSERLDGTEFVAASANDLEKTVPVFDSLNSDYTNYVAVEDPTFMDQVPLQQENIPVQPENTYLEVDTIDDFLIPVQVSGVSSATFEQPGPVSYSAVAEPLSQSDVFVEVQTDSVAPQPMAEEVLFVEVDPSIETKSNPRMTAPPLLPPLMKVSRILN